MQSAPGSSAWVSMPSKSLPSPTKSSPPILTIWEACRTISAMVPGFFTPALQGERKSAQKFKPATPPFTASARIISSVRFLVQGQSALALLWLATKGFFVICSTSKNPASDIWETSTIIPISSMHSTNSLPFFVRPCSVSGVFKYFCRA